MGFYERKYTEKRKAYFFFDIVVPMLVIMSAIFLWAKYYVSLEGRGVPTKEGLNYSTGVVRNVHVYTDSKGRTQKHIQIYDQNLKQTLQIGCGNKVYPKYQRSNCYLEEYDGKIATIGWYYVPDLWWFHNEIPQLMTFESGGIEVRNYDKQIEYMNSANTLMFFVSLVFSSIFIWAAFK